MKKADFEKIEILEVTQGEYIIEVETVDNGAGTIDIDYTPEGKVEYLDITKANDSELISAFFENLDTRLDTLDYLFALGATLRAMRVEGAI